MAAPGIWGAGRVGDAGNRLKGWELLAALGAAAGQQDVMVSSHTARLLGGCTRLFMTRWQTGHARVATQGISAPGTSSPLAFALPAVSYMLPCS